MKRILAVVFVLAIVLSAQAQILEKVYFGGLYFCKMPTAYQVQNEISPLAAIKTKIPLATGYLRTRIMFDFPGSRAQFWWEKDFSHWNFRVGHMPRPIAVVNKPEPVSADANFIPPFKAVIPGAASGISGTGRFGGNETAVGLFQTGRDSTELNFAIQQSVNLPILRKIGVSGYRANFRSNPAGEYVNGTAFNADIRVFTDVSLLFFRGIDKNSVETRSAFFCANLPKSWGFFGGSLWQGGHCQIAQSGLFKNMEEQVGIFKVKCLVGFGCSYSEFVPKRAITFYLQAWLDK